MSTIHRSNTERLILLMDPAGEREELRQMLLREHLPFDIPERADPAALTSFLEGQEGDNQLTVLVDLDSKGFDGLETCRLVSGRTWNVRVGILAIGGHCQDSWKALEAGADDVQVSRTSPRELLARIRSLSRRAGGSLAREIPPGIPSVPGVGNARLTLSEARLFLRLFEDCDRVVKKEILQEGFRDPDSRSVTENNLAVHMCSLRKKLGKIPGNPYSIETHWGIGYRLHRSGDFPPG